jgi:subtilisin family serine protease
VVNISWGRPYDTNETLDPPGPLRQAIQNLYNNGIVVVAAAGNDPNVEVSALVPSGYPEVLAVAATTGDLSSTGCAPGVLRDTASFFTTDGKLNASNIGVTTSAPGDERETSLTFGFYCLLVYDGILSTSLGGGVSRQVAGAEAAGTSFAAPHVVGAVARMIQKGSSGVEAIRSELRSTASLVNSAPLDHPWGGLYITYTYDLEREGIAQAPP